MANTYADRGAGGQPTVREAQPGVSQQPTSEPSITELFSNLIGDAQILVRKEFTLARQEIQQELDKARRVAIVLAIGAAILAVGSILLLVALVQGLVLWFELPTWVSYLIVGGAFAIVGGMMVALGSKQLKQVHPIPEEAIDSVRKDISWLKEQNPSDKI